MEALKLAFETIIVGALALPWLIIIIDVFLRPKGSENVSIWQLVLPYLAPFKDPDDKATLVVAGVFLFAATYFVGAAITRVSGDFFNDDDFWIPRLRLPTEDNVRTDVYCDPVARQFVRADGAEAAVTTSNCQKAAAVRTLGTLKSDNLEVPTNSYCVEDAPCPDPLSANTLVTSDDSKKAKELIQQTFYRKEAALVLNSDKIDRLNQLHSQDLVLRGAAFDGLITVVLCFFAMGGQTRWHLIWLLFPIILLVGGLRILLFIHIPHNALDDPPFMEFTAVVLGLVGMGICWRGSRGPTSFSRLLVIASLLTLFAGFGWWWAEVLYDRLVIYSFYATILAK
jgi:hypothetical protein